MDAISDNTTLEWLMKGDLSIRYQTLRDLTKTKYEKLNEIHQSLPDHGWCARFLSLQDPKGTWASGLYSPKWTSTTYTLLTLKLLGFPPHHEQILRSCEILLDKGFYKDGGINISKSMKHSETCVTGLFLSMFCFFGYQSDKLHDLTEYLLDQQMPDGGWNCRTYYGATHGSFHTTILALEALIEYELQFPGKSCLNARKKAHEFLLEHELFLSHRTKNIVDPKMTRFAFPPRWRYDIMRALDYFRLTDVKYDTRFTKAISLIEKKKLKNGTWKLQNKYPGRTFFEMEEIGKPSRWNTLRALRIMKWWKIISAPLNNSLPI